MGRRSAAVLFLAVVLTGVPALAQVGSSPEPAVGHGSFPGQQAVRTGKDLDLLWAKGLKEGDQGALAAILTVANWDDLFRARTEATLAAGLSDEALKDLTAALAALSVTVEGTHVRSANDLDILFGVLIRDPKFGPGIKQIIALTQAGNDELYSMALKSAAFWSTVSNAQQHAEVRDFVTAHLGELRPEVRAMLAPRI